MLEGTFLERGTARKALSQSSQTHTQRTLGNSKGIQRTHLYSSAKKMSRPWSSSNSAVKDKQSDNHEHRLLSVSFLLFHLHLN